MVKVGRMRNKLLLFLAGCAVSFGLACSHQTGSAAKKPTSAPAVAVASTSEGARLTALRSELEPEPRLLIRTEGKPSFVSYSPQPDVFVLDFAKTAKQTDLMIPTNLPSFVATVSADEAVEGTTPMTRVTVRFKQPMTPRAMVTDEGAVVRFDAVEHIATVDIPVTAGVVTEELAISEPLPAPTPTVVQESIPADAKRATVLKGIHTSGSGMTLQIMLDADGALDYKALHLTSPLRLVFDLNGIKNKVKTATINLGDPFVKRIRVSQFKGAPDPVARVVLDLDELVDYRVERMSDGVRVAFGEAPAMNEPVPVAIAEAAMEPAAAPVFAAEMQGASDVATDLAPAPQTSTVSPIPITTRAQTTAGTVRSTPVEDVFVEPAQSGAAMTGGVIRPGERREIGPGERVYTGEPITLNLKDADIKDVLRTFAQLTGLNIAIDPQVSGTVTVQFESVPW